MYARWWGDKLWTMVPGVTIVGQFLATFREYPPSQRAERWALNGHLKWFSKEPAAPAISSGLIEKSKRRRPPQGSLLAR